MLSEFFQLLDELGALRLLGIRLLLLFGFVFELLEASLSADL